MPEASSQELLRRTELDIPEEMKKRLEEDID